MKNKLHIVTGVLWLAILFFDLVVWGGVKAIPDIGPKIRDAAQNQAPLALTYMVIGEQLDTLVPGLGSFGTDYAADAFYEVTPRIKEDPNLAIALLFDRSTNARHSTVHFMFWAMPVMFVLFLLFWWMRPRKVSMMGSRR